MIAKLFVAALCALIVTGCQKDPKLSDDEAAVIDALVFLTLGYEDQVKGRYDTSAWTRRAIGSRVEYHSIQKYAASTSSPPPYLEKVRDSAFVKIDLSVGMEQKCRFSMHEQSQFSRGSSQDFTAHETNFDWAIDLNRVYLMEVRVASYGLAYFDIEGKSALCSGDKCSDREEFYIADYVSDESLEKRRTALQRRERAIAFIKKICPGKPY